MDALNAQVGMRFSHQFGLIEEQIPRPSNATQACVDPLTNSGCLPLG
jgi:hypothetical protein